MTKQIHKGVAYTVFELFMQQVIMFCVEVVLARLLLPSDYGLVAMITIFVVLSTTVVQGGIPQALLRKKSVGSNEMFTAYVLNISLSILMYGLLFSFAPFIADFFQEPILLSLLRVVGLLVILEGLSAIHTVHLMIQWENKKLSLINLSSQVIGGVIAVVCALQGMGVWALAIQQIVASIIRLLLCLRYGSYKMVGKFDIESFQYLWQFGSKLTLTNLIGSFFNEMYSFVIGKYLGKSDLGYFTKARQLATRPSGLSSSAITRLALPILSKTKDDKEKLLENFRFFIQIISFLIFPISIGLAVVAEPLILWIWTEKWVNSIIIFQIMIVAYAFNPLSTLQFCLPQLLNKTDLLLKLELIKKLIFIIILLLTSLYGLLAIVYGILLYTLIGVSINAVVSQKLIDYSLAKQFSDIIRFTLYALIAFGSVSQLNLMNHSYAIDIFVTIVSGGTVYLALCFVFEKKFILLMKRQILIYRTG